MDIDRDALTKLALDLFEASMLWGRGDDIPEPNIEVFVGAVLALVRPVEGIVISRQDAADLAFVARVGEPHVLDTERAERVLTLAARLEAAQ